MERGAQVRVEDEVPQLVVEVVERLVTRDAGVVHQHVHLAELVGGAGHHLAGLIELDRIVRGDLGPASGFLHRLRGLLGGLGVDVVDHDRRSLLGEPDGGGPPDPSPGPRDDGDPALQSCQSSS